MTQHIKAILATLLVLVLVAGGTWLWYETLELRWRARVHVSEAAQENRLLGATLLLRQNGHPVALSSTLGELAVPRIADGTLIMSDANGMISPATARELLAWVRRGNTLVMQPRGLTRAEQKIYLATLTAHDAPSVVQADQQADDNDDAAEQDEAQDEEQDEEQDEDEDGDEGQADAAPAARPDAAEQLESDPIGARLGVRAYWQDPPCQAAPATAKTRDKPCALPAAPLRRLGLPGTGYWAELDPGRNRLVSMAGAAAPQWSDEHADTVRTYAEGKGHIVMLAFDFFDNTKLQRHDHAELLLALAALNPRARHVTLVQHLNMLPWYQALWVHYQALLISLAVCTALALWGALRRFGPMLPQPANERRSLMEHIDASGAWLWKVAGGRQVLLEAARADTLELVRRRAPKLVRLPPQHMAEALARLAGLDQQHVMQALQQDAAPQVAVFTRQIRTLQELRNHYER